MTGRDTKQALKWEYFKGDEMAWEIIESALAEERENENNETKKEIEAGNTALEATDAI
jgi:hypothetical protein